MPEADKMKVELNDVIEWLETHAEDYCILEDYGGSITDRFSAEIDVVTMSKDMKRDLERR